MGFTAGRYLSPGPVWGMYFKCYLSPGRQSYWSQVRGLQPPSVRRHLSSNPDGARMLSGLYTSALFLQHYYTAREKNRGREACLVEWENFCLLWKLILKERSGLRLITSESVEVGWRWAPHGQGKRGQLRAEILCGGLEGSKGSLPAHFQPPGPVSTVPGCF